MKYIIIFTFFCFFSYGCSFDRNSSFWDYPLDERKNPDKKVDLDITNFEKYKNNLIKYSNNLDFPDINKIKE